MHVVKEIPSPLSLVLDDTRYRTSLPVCQSVAFSET
jgi:hypothetical protein